MDGRAWANRSGSAHHRAATEKRASHATVAAKQRRDVEVLLSVVLVHSRYDLLRGVAASLRSWREVVLETELGVQLLKDDVMIWLAM